MRKEHIEKLVALIQRVRSLQKEANEFDEELSSNIDDLYMEDSDYGELYDYVANANCALVSLLDDLLDVRRMLHVK